MSPRKHLLNIIVSEEFRIQSESSLRNFMQDDSQTIYEFPKNLTNVERAWLHNYAKTLGLISKSYGKEPERVLTISKQKPDKMNTNKIFLQVQKQSVAEMREFLRRYPLIKEKTDLQSLKLQTKDGLNINMGQLTYGSPSIPEIQANESLLDFRVNLPIWPMREQIMNVIEKNQVVIVCGETGSGKTTQIPQFILDYSASCSEKCRVICTQPRRISAVTVAERVACERGEKSGQTVGFHIRLESCVGPKTMLVYCTNGILLRTLMNGDACLNSYTHIIIDEIHERDRFSDFLLICLRECLVNYPHIRLILMSATIDINIFKAYFYDAPVIHIPGRLHHVNEFYLEDILNMLNYESSAMASLKEKNKNKTTTSTANNLNPDLETEMIECVTDCIENGTENSFTHLLQLILSENAPVNFAHPNSGYTGLMAAALHGNLEICTQLLRFGADARLECKTKKTASDLAISKNHQPVADVLRHFEQDFINYNPIIKDAELLDLYQKSVTDHLIDFNLLQALLFDIHTNPGLGSILVFLAGYDEIVTLKDMIINDRRFSSIPYEIFTLHGMMQINEQHKVFEPFEGKRKIILSSNIAETSITIDDVVYVIDVGKVKEKNFDAITGICSLQATWVSQACAKQRAGRAGRTKPGLCFHLFSKYRYSALQPFATPEILRMPLHELCLQTKILAPKETKIAEFLARAIEPPSTIAVTAAIKHLQEIDALDEMEELTVLGHHLVDLPIEPRLAKILIYSVIFKCVDPLLTLVAFLSYRDPFMLPNNYHQKSLAFSTRKEFEADTFSDHMILLNAFQLWQEARISRTEKTFCNKYFISNATMDIVVNIRSQLLAQLRASGFVKSKPPGDIRDLNEFADNWSLIKGVLAIGFYPNLAYINKLSGSICTKKEKKVLLHTSSRLRIDDHSTNNSNHAKSLVNIPSDWLIYEELSRTGIHYNIRSVTAISPLAVALFIDSNAEEISSNMFSATLTLNDWIVFEESVDLLNMIKAFRQKLDFTVLKKISNPYKTTSSHDEYLLKTVSTILSIEDHYYNLNQPTGIGKRPKIILSNTYPLEHGARNTQQHYTRASRQLIEEVLQFKNVNKPVLNLEPNEIPIQTVDATLTEYLHSMDLNKTFDPPFYSSAENFSNFDIAQYNATSENEISLFNPQNDAMFQIPPPPPFMPFENRISYVVIKSPSIECIDISVIKKTWRFSPQTERKLTYILQAGQTIMLIFTTHGSKYFNGIARLINIPAMSLEGPCNYHCPVEWLSRANILISEIRGMEYLCMADGDELDSNFGIELWMKFMSIPPASPVHFESFVVPSGRAITGRTEFH